jgi:hypothetical protein
MINIIITAVTVSVVALTYFSFVVWLTLRWENKQAATETEPEPEDKIEWHLR